MTVPELSVTPHPATSVEADVLAVFVRKTEDGPVIVSEDAAVLELGSALAHIGVSGAVDEVRRIPALAETHRSVALVGVGTTLSANDLRYAAGSATRQLRGVDTLVFDFAGDSGDDVLAILEGAAIGAYGFDDYRSSAVDASRRVVSRIVVASEAPGGAELSARAAVVATAIHDVRDLVNTPPSDLYPETFALRARELAEGSPVEVEILREPELEAGGFGGILGVGLGSTRGPRLVKVSYSPAEATKHIALVGKGITFDSGGLSLKPPVSMVGMKYDMTGAATVLAVTLAAARLGLDVRMTAWLCIAENLPSGSAMRPNDVLRIRGGKTVEVLNTDAEGRLVLADGLVAAGEEHPDAIIDVATLTGAARIALGDRYAAVMGDDDLVARYVDVARRVGESAWPMPLPSELRSLLASDVADIANVKPGHTAAGMLIAGVFLREFIATTGDGEARRSIPWAHLDIAGPANNGGSGFGFVGKGPTGVTVRALLALAEEFSAA
jgi:leucyl aminopeptidase